MKITRDNYEQYFLDHAEGTLSQEMERELADFLEANPDLKSLSEGFDVFTMLPEETKNDTLKRRLKKDINPTLHIDETHVDEWLVREIEGLLDPAEAKELEEFLTLNPAYVFDQRLYWLTRLGPDLSVKFSQKDKLKKKAPVTVIIGLARAAAAAAAIILTIIGIRYFNQSEIARNPQVIQMESMPVTEVHSPDPADIENMPEEQKLLAQVKPSGGMESPGTLPPSPRPGPFRMEPSAAIAVISFDPSQRTEFILVAHNTPSIISGEKKEKPLIARVFVNFLARAQDAVRGNPEPGKVRENNLDFWSIAEAGVKGYNNMSDRDLQLLVRRDENGKIKSYALLEEDRLLLSKSLDKN